MATTLHYNDNDFNEILSEALTQKGERAPDIRKSAKAIMDRVKAKGDQAVMDYTNQYDHQSVRSFTELRVTKETMDQAVAQADPEFIRALKLAIARVEEYQLAIMPKPISYKDSVGMELQNIWRPMERVGIYVPGGKAAYPSSVIHNAVPALTAGVKELAMVVPAPHGKVSPLVLVAASLLQIEEVYMIGGAQAIAALSYGTESIAKVDKIVGPGNAYVAAAKILAYGDVGIDMVAGPSEIVVVADGNANPEIVAMDLLSQAEHDEEARVILISTDEASASAICKAVEDALLDLPRKAIAQKSWEDHGMVIVTPDDKASIEVINQIAPEHLLLLQVNASVMIEEIQHAGAIFVGEYTPEAIGDYVAGPSHVLPTSSTARFASGLSVFDFLKRMSVMQSSKQSFDALAPATELLATEEGLTAHAASVRLRQSQ